ncbi:NAD-dependent epimerase/dehydratase family protein [bacterium]|nr:NAD-dependent epimerase/dehydratase family protein [bacterium]MBU1919107.1 NAD-dependent epimerase/dehydratase family protein [bacterium]
MKIFITGATGFIGQHLCHHLTKQGHHVFALIRNEKKTSCLPQDNITLITGSLASFTDKNFNIPECDLVIHLAGTITANKISHYNQDNHIAVKDLVACLKRQSWIPRRFIFASSQAASGPSTNNAALTEKDPAHPIDAYGQAKHKAENFILSQKDFPATIIRPPSVIGPLDTNILNMFKIAKFGFGFLGGTNPMPMSYVALSDLICAIDLLSDDATTDNRIYFVAHPIPTTSMDLWKAVGKALNKQVKVFILPKFLLYTIMKLNTLFSRLFGVNNVFDKKYYDQIHAPGWVVSSEKLTNDFRWEATKSLDEALKETYESYVDAGWI